MSAPWAEHSRPNVPNRILREGILTSERVGGLSVHAEVFYRRLMSVVDDFGRYYAKPMTLRAACYPTKIDKVKDADIEAWMEECAAQNLVRMYSVAETRFIELLDFRQQIRAKKSKYPDPVGYDEHAPIEREAHAQQANDKNAHYRAEAATIIAFLNEKAERNFDLNGANAAHVIARLKEGESVEDMRAVIAKKCREWKGDPKMCMYLRPETLFNRTKYASYKGELGVSQ